MGNLVTIDGPNSCKLYRGNLTCGGWLLQGQALLLRVGGDNLATIAYTGGEVEAMTTEENGVYLRGIAPDGSAVLYYPRNLLNDIPFYLHSVGSKAQVLMDCYDCSLTAGSWTQDGSGILLSVYLYNRLGSTRVVYIPLGAPGTPVSQTVDVWHWEAYFLPFSARYAVMEYKGWGYPPPESIAPIVLDTSLITEMRMPFILEDIEWRYLP